MNTKVKKNFDIVHIITKLSKKRPIFVSEADLQFEMAWTIKEEYPDADIMLEYCPYFNTSMHIDILVIMNNRHIPIELKYKTKECKTEINGEIFALKTHGAKDVSCYSYLRDIQRIEEFKEKDNKFQEGYTVFITNQLSYKQKPRRNSFYAAFSLEDGSNKSGDLDWAENTSDGTKGSYADPIFLKYTHAINWKPYSEIYNINNNKTEDVIYLSNKIPNNK